MKWPSSHVRVLTDTEQTLGVQDCEPQRRGLLTQVRGGVNHRKCMRSSEKETNRREFSQGMTRLRMELGPHLWGGVLSPPCCSLELTGNCSGRTAPAPQTTLSCPAPQNQSWSTAHLTSKHCPPSPASGFRPSYLHCRAGSLAGGLGTPLHYTYLTRLMWAFSMTLSQASRGCKSFSLGT